MRKILITGKNSFVGNSLEKWLGKHPKKYLVEKISLRNKSWKEKDFSKYNVVVHVAGIAHIQETKKNEELYYRVNRDLAYEVALKAKIDGVNQFIYLSSMSVYGVRNGVITKKTPLNPTTNYGKSKLQAEKLIGNLEDQSFRVAILRPPMIYGKGCKGNYVRLSNFAKKTPIFPNIENKRSMIYIENLCEFIKYLIDNNSRGLFFPQNENYVNTSRMVELIALANGRKIILTKVFNPLIYFLMRYEFFNKVFGDLVYEKNMSCIEEIEQVPFPESIKRTEM